MNRPPTPSPGDQPAAAPGLWHLEPGIDYLNHGAFGACPRAVLEVQQLWRERLERQPLRLFLRELEPLLDEARALLAGFLNAAPEDLVFVPNATAGLSTVLRSLEFAPGDELLVTNHEYNASKNALDFTAARCGARVIVARVPFPLQSEEEIFEAVMGAVTARTRLCLLDHVTSQTGLIFPIARLIEALAARGIQTLIDGAHAPGMVPIDLQSLGADFYTGNCHKWLCAPKGAGFLHVRRDRQKGIRPLAISHGANSPRSDRSPFLIEHGWTGTGDPSAWLCVPEAMKTIEGLVPGGWPSVRARNHALAVAGRAVLCEALGIAPPCPENLLGSLAAIPLPDACAPLAAPLFLDPLQDRLLFAHGIEVPLMPWPAPPGRLIRISAQLYNRLPQYRRLAAVLKTELRATRL